MTLTRNFISWIQFPSPGSGEGPGNLGGHGG